MGAGAGRGRGLGWESSVTWLLSVSPPENELGGCAIVKVQSHKARDCNLFHCRKTGEGDLEQVRVGPGVAVGRGR